MKNVLLLISCCLFSAFLAVFVYRQLVEPQQVVVKETLASPTLTNYNPNDILFSGKLQRTFASTSPTDFTSAAVTAMPAVVYIRARSQGSWRSMQGSSSGSGVLITSNGYIVTNNHVIESGGEIEVLLNDNSEYLAEVIGSDPNTDLALIKIDVEDLPYLIFGNSDSLEIGEWVMAVGNPFGLQSTVTAGIVSAKGRNINILQEKYAIESFIQTDAAVNPGNSGGALINTKGQLIGINTAIMTYTGRYEGYSFAVPANLAIKVIHDLREYGSVQRGLLGVSIMDINNDLVRRLNKENITEVASELGLQSNNGIYINDVTDGSGAEDAGLEVGDVIVGINDVTTNNIAELQDQIGRLSPGDQVSLKYIRKKQTFDALVTLKNMNNTTDRLNIRRDPVLIRVGFEVRDLTESEKRELDVDGVKVESIYQGTAVEKTNMEPGFIITRINDNALTSAEDLVTMLKGSQGSVQLDGRYPFSDEPFTYKFWKE